MQIPTIRAQRKKHRLRQKQWTEVEKLSISMGFPTSVPEKGALEEYMKDSEKDALKLVYKEGLLSTEEMKLA